VDVAVRDQLRARVHRRQHDEVGARGVHDLPGADRLAHHQRQAQVGGGRRGRRRGRGRRRAIGSGRALEGGEPLRPARAPIVLGRPRQQPAIDRRGVGQASLPRAELGHRLGREQLLVHVDALPVDRFSGLARGRQLFAAGRRKLSTVATTKPIQMSA
jgi:hypothetical protein